MENKMAGSQDVMYLLRVLEEEISGAKKAVFGGGKIIDESRCIAIINDIRFNLPSAISNANAVVKERDNIIDDAMDRAERIVRDAEEKARTLIDNHEIIAKATEESEYIIAKAKSYGDMITNETLANIDELLEESERGIADILTAIKASRNDVDGMRRSVETAPRSSASYVRGDGYAERRTDTQRRDMDYDNRNYREEPQRREERYDDYGRDTRRESDYRNREEERRYSSVGSYDDKY